MEQPSAASPIEMTRDEAVRRLRYHLVQLTDDEHSVCQVAAKKGIFCHGFARWTDAELKERFAGLLKRRPGLNRWQLEALANEWELARQMVDKVRIACDAQTLEHDTCGGWDDFGNEDLARFCKELLGMDVVVVTPPKTGLELPGLGA